MKDRGDLLEWARVFDNHYGTPRAPVEAANLAGKDVPFDIDWQVRSSCQQPGDVVRVPVLPSSGPVLRNGSPAHKIAGNGGAAHGGGIRRNQPLARVRLRDRQQRSETSVNSALAILPPSASNAPASWPFGVRARYAGGAKQPFDHRDRRCSPASQILQSSALQPVALALFPLLAAELRHFVGSEARTQHLLRCRRPLP